MWAKTFLLFVLFSTVDSCPTAVRNICSCQNDQEGVVLQCIGQPMEDLVHLLLVNQAQLGLIKQLTIQQSQPIANITAKFFDGLYIKKLVVQHSNIQRIDAHAFDGLANTLQDLNLAHNQIREVPSEALNKLSSLLSLDLSNNSISDLTAKHALPTLPKLFEINLGNNKIGDVHKSFFETVKNHIQSINMGHNEFRSVPASALRGFRQLMALHLHSNKITSLDSLSFMNLPLVSLLNLADNRIKSINRQAFINVPKLRYLYLTNNKIEDVLPNQFGSFEQLEMIDMSSNRISNLTAGSFSNLPQLRQLYLGNNRIMDIQTEAFTNSSITVLILENNQLKEVTEHMFKGMAQLQQLSLKENKINNIHQNSFYDTPALVIVDLSHNEIFDLAPSTFVSQPNILLIDLSYNKIVRVPYGAFGRRVVTVLLQENPLVCTERVHMLQQGVGMLISNNEDVICGAQRSIDKTIADENKRLIQPFNQTTSRGSEGFNNDPAARRPQAQPNPILQNEDLLASAFRKAEEDERRFRENGGFVPRGDEHQHEPQLNPPIPTMSVLNNAGPNEEVIQRPSTASTSGKKTPSELSIRPLITGTKHETATNKQSTSSAESDKEVDSTIHQDGNLERTVDSAPVPDFKPPTKIHPAYPITLPPGIVVASSSTHNQPDEKIDLTPETTKNNRMLMTSAGNLSPPPPSRTSMKNQEGTESFNVDELQRVSTSQQTPSTNSIEIRGNKSLPTLLIIICLSTVGIVLIAVFVGMCFVHQRRGQQHFLGSSNSSITARSNSYYGTNNMVRQYPNSQTYISPNQFDASQLNTLQRTRRNSMTYATPTPLNDDVYTWLYAPGPYSTTNPSFPNK